MKVLASLNSPTPSIENGTLNVFRDLRSLEITVIIVKYSYKHFTIVGPNFQTIHLFRTSFD